MENLTEDQKTALTAIFRHYSADYLNGLVGYKYLQEMASICEAVELNPAFTELSKSLSI